MPGEPWANWLRLAESNATISPVGHSRGLRSMLMPINEFSHSFMTPLLGFAMSFLGAFLGLRCTTQARAYFGWGRVRWLMLAGLSLGLAAWLGHFIEMLGFAVPGEAVRYS